MQVVPILNDEIPKTPRRAKKTRSPPLEYGPGEQARLQLKDLRTQLENSKIALEERQKELDEKVALYNNRFKYQQTEIYQLTLISEQTELDNNRLKEQNASLLTKVEQDQKDIAKLENDINQQQSDFNELLESQKQKYDSELDSLRSKAEEGQLALYKEADRNEELIEKAKKYKQQMLEKQQYYYQFSQKMKRKFNEKEVEMIELYADLKQQLIEKQYELNYKIMQPANSEQLLQLQIENYNMKLKIDALQYQYQSRIDQMQKNQKLSYFKLDESHSNMRREQTSKIQELEQQNYQLRSSIDQLEAAYSERLDSTRYELKESKYALVEHNQQFLDSQRSLQSETLLLTSRLAESQLNDTQLQIGECKERERSFRAQITSLRRQLQQTSEKHESETESARIYRVELQDAVAALKAQLAEQKAQLSAEYLDQLNGARHEVVNLRSALQSCNEHCDYLVRSNSERINQLVRKHQEDVQMQAQYQETRIKAQEAYFEAQLTYLRADAAAAYQQLYSLRHENFLLKSAKNDEVAAEAQKRSKLADALAEYLEECKRSLAYSNERHAQDLTEARTLLQVRVAETAQVNKELTSEIRKQYLGYERYTSELRLLFREKELNLQRLHDEQTAKLKSDHAAILYRKDAELTKKQEELDDSRESAQQAASYLKADFTYYLHDAEFQKIYFGSKIAEIQSQLEAATQRNTALCDQITDLQQVQKAIEEAKSKLERRVAGEYAENDAENDTAALQIADLKQRITIYREELENRIIQLREGYTAQITSLYIYITYQNANVQRLTAEKALLEYYAATEREQIEKDRYYYRALAYTRISQLAAYHAEEIEQTYAQAQFAASQIEAKIVNLETYAHEAEMEQQNRIKAKEREFEQLEAKMRELELQIDAERYARLLQYKEARIQAEDAAKASASQLKYIQDELGASIATKEYEIAALRRELYSQASAHALNLYQADCTKQQETARLEGEVARLRAQLGSFDDCKAEELHAELEQQRRRLENTARQQAAEFQQKTESAVQEAQRLLHEKEALEVRLKQAQTQAYAQAAAQKEEAVKYSQYYLSLLAQRRKEVQQKDAELHELHRLKLEEISKLEASLSDANSKNNVSLVQYMDQIVGAYNTRLNAETTQNARLSEYLLEKEEECHARVEQVSDEKNRYIRQLMSERDASEAEINRKCAEAEAKSQHFRLMSEQLQVYIDALTASYTQEIVSKQQILLRIIEDMRRQPGLSGSKNIIEQIAASFQTKEDELRVQTEELQRRHNEELASTLRKHEADVSALSSRAVELEMAGKAASAAHERERCELQYQIEVLEEKCTYLRGEFDRQREELLAQYSTRSSQLQAEAQQFQRLLRGAEDERVGQQMQLVKDYQEQIRSLTDYLAQQYKHAQEELAAAQNASFAASAKAQRQLAAIYYEKQRMETTNDGEIAGLKEQCFKLQQSMADQRDKMAALADENHLLQERLAAERQALTRALLSQSADEQALFAQKCEERMRYAEIGKTEALQQLAAMQDQLLAYQATISGLQEEIAAKYQYNADLYREQERYREEAEKQHIRELERLEASLQAQAALESDLKKQEIDALKAQHENTLHEMTYAHEMEAKAISEHMRQQMTYIAAEQKTQLSDSVTSLTQCMEHQQAESERQAKSRSDTAQKMQELMLQLAEKQAEIEDLRRRLRAAAAQKSHSQPAARPTAQQKLALQDCAMEARFIRARLQALRGQLEVTLPGEKALAKMTYALLAVRPAVSAQENAYFTSRLAVIQEMEKSATKSIARAAFITLQTLQQRCEELAAVQRSQEAALGAISSSRNATAAVLAELVRLYGRSDREHAEFAAYMHQAALNQPRSQLFDIQQNWLERSASTESRERIESLRMQQRRAAEVEGQSGQESAFIQLVAQWCEARDEQALSALRVAAHGPVQARIAAYLGMSVGSESEESRYGENDELDKRAEQQERARQDEQRVERNAHYAFIYRLAGCGIGAAEQAMRTCGEDCQQAVEALARTSESILYGVFDYFTKQDFISELY